MQVVPTFRSSIQTLNTHRTPTYEVRFASDVITRIENIARLSHITHTQRRLVLENLAFFFQSREARVAVHHYATHMPDQVLSEHAKMNEL